MSENDEHLSEAGQAAKALEREGLGRTNPSLREMILARMEFIRVGFGADRFGTPNRKGNLTGLGQIWPKDVDFSKLSDKALVQEFERLVAAAYRQR